MAKYKFNIKCGAKLTPCEVEADTYEEALIEVKKQAIRYKGQKVDTKFDRNKLDTRDSDPIAAFNNFKKNAEYGDSIKLDINGKKAIIEKQANGWYLYCGDTKVKGTSIIIEGTIKDLAKSQTKDASFHKGEFKGETVGEVKKNHKFMQPDAIIDPSGKRLDLYKSDDKKVDWIEVRSGIVHYHVKDARVKSLYTSVQDSKTKSLDSYSIYVGSKYFGKANDMTSAKSQMKKAYEKTLKLDDIKCYGPKGQFDMYDVFDIKYVNGHKLIQSVKDSELAWQEFDKNDRVVTKRKEFKTKEAMDKFIDKVTEKDNFYRIIGTRDSSYTNHSKTFFSEKEAKKFKDVLEKQSCKNVEIWSDKDGFGQTNYIVKWTKDSKSFDAKDSKPFQVDKVIMHEKFPSGQIMYIVKSGNFYVTTSDPTGNGGGIFDVNLRNAQKTFESQKTITKLEKKYGKQEAYKRWMAGATDSIVSVYTGPWSNANYGKQPRGYGNWAFAYKRNPSVDEMFFFSGNYADAKKKAVEKAKAEGKTSIYVLS